MIFTGEQWNIGLLTIFPRARLVCDVIDSIVRMEQRNCNRSSLVRSITSKGLSPFGAADYEDLSESEVVSFK